MSYILDALRRSERERLPGAAHVRDPGPALLPPRRVVLFAAPVVGLTLGALALYWVLSGPPAAPPDGARMAAVVPATTAVPAAAPPVRAAEAEAPAPAVKSPPASPRARSLAEQVRIPPAPAKTAPKADPLPGTVISASLPPAPRTVATRDSVRLLRAMPPDFQRALPELAVTIHVYAANESERILYINNREYHAGDKVQDDIMVEQIVEDGAVLSFRGQRFKLPRPS